MKSRNFLVSWALSLVAITTPVLASDHITKITVISRDGNSNTIYNDGNVDRIEVGQVSHTYTMERVTDKSSWRVLYGSIAMPYYRT